MTLKTTKEQRDALLIFIADPDFAVYNTVTLYNSVVRDFCHDAGRAEELEEAMEGLQAEFILQNSLVTEQAKENADLRAKLNGA